MWFQMENGTLVELKDTLYTMDEVNIKGDIIQGDTYYEDLFCIYCGKRRIYSSKLENERDKKFTKIKNSLEVII